MSEGEVKAYLITSDRCPACAKAKETFKRELERGEITELNMDRNPKVRVLADALNLVAIPVIVYGERRSDGRMFFCSHHEPAKGKCAVVDEI